MVTTIAQALVLVLGLLAGRIWPREARRGLLTQESWVNLLNGAVLFAGKQGVVLGLVYLGVQPLEGRLLDLTGLPGAVQFLIAFLTLDFARYWLHYADHRVPLLWSFHRVHHSAEAMDATTGFRMHLVDFVQLAAVPLVLFGVLFRVSDGWPMHAALTVGIVADAIEHANVRFTLDTPFRRLWFQVFNTPLFHSWHHTRDGQICDGNYANALPLWDRLFGTEVTREVPPELYGVEDKQALESSWLGLQLLRPGPRQLRWRAGTAAAASDSPKAS
ncbi:MAG: sterol desaturase family protein [Pseudomonadota bacterium]|nr:sterol desaturase family protein [Pseudomonadota bacterium]